MDFGNPNIVLSKNIPNYLLHEYDFEVARLFDIELVFAIRKNKENFTTEQYRKHIEILSNHFDRLTILVISKLEAYARLKLIQKKVPYIVPFKQMYIPQLFIDIKEGKSPEVNPELNMSPAAQFLILYHLMKKPVERYIFKDIAGFFNGIYSTMTLSRIANELQTRNICLVEGTKEKRIVFNYKREELWQAVEKSFTTPVKSKIYINSGIDDKFLYQTGITALSEYTEIAGDKQPHYAIYHKNYYRLKSESIIDSVNAFEGDTAIEVWKYDPGLLSNGRIVDPLSLYLSLRESNEPRVMIEIEKLIRNFKW